jgi:L-threonylcarbamoyladenylate synthase
LNSKSGARIFRGTPRNLALLARLLRAGEPVAVPTETVYGLAADALNAKACLKIFRAKGRPSTDPLIVHVLSWNDVGDLAVANEAARRLARRFWPGPLTLVLPKKSPVPDVVTSGMRSVAVRSPSHPLLRKLLALAGRPLAAPSANAFGYVSPTTAEHVRRGLGKKIGFILDGGPCRIGLESTIVDLRIPARPRLLRPGGISRKAIESVLGIPVPTASRTRGARRTQIAPGQLERHYSPRTPLELHSRLSARRTARGEAGEAWLFLKRPSGVTAPSVFWLDAGGDLKRAARRLFSMLRNLDEAGFKTIHVELARAPSRRDRGIADAINDRLRRAAASPVR